MPVFCLFSHKKIPFSDFLGFSGSDLKSFEYFEIFKIVNNPQYIWNPKGTYFFETYLL